MNTRNIEMAKHATLLAMAGFLAACGGGGGSSATVPDNSAAISAALSTVASTIPVTPAFTGAFTLVDGVSAGFVAGTSEKEVATTVANKIIASPSTYPNQYSLMLSDAGLKISIVGSAIGTSAITGLTLYAPNTVFTAKLRSDGLHLTW
jgi:hypothetical protein